MRMTVLIFAALAGSCAAPPSPSAYAPRHATELAGRVAGAAERCVDFTPIDTMRVSESDLHTLVYGNGKTIWANDLGSCGFRRGDILVTEPLGPRYCRGDIVRSVDQLSHLPGPTCVLGDFVPYSRG